MLDAKLALAFASELRTVREFPRDQSAVDATAEDLIDLTLDCPEIEAANRARWLVTEIRRTWEEWGGTAELFRLYETRWPRQRDVKTEDNEFKNFGDKPKIQCLVCNDTGVIQPDPSQPYQWCECEQGILLHFDLPNWLELLNAKPRPRLRRTAEAEPTNPNYRPITQADIDRALQENRDKKAREELLP